MKQQEIKQLYAMMFPDYPDIVNVAQLQKMLKRRWSEGEKARGNCDRIEAKSVIWIEATRGLTGGEEGCYRRRGNIGILKNGNSLCGETIDKMIFFCLSL